MTNPSSFGERDGRSHAKPWRWLRIVHALRGLSTRRGYGAEKPLRLSSKTLFDSLSVARVVADLRQHGFHAGISIPDDIARELVEHAERQYCSRAPGDPERFRIDQVVNGRTPSGSVVAVADVASGPGRAAWTLAGDAKLAEVVRAYHGYPATRVSLRLYWTPPFQLPNDEQRDRTIDFHYVIEPRPALYLWFHLGDTESDAGAHVIVTGSHRTKPPGLRWASTRQREQAILSAYGSDKIIVLESRAGLGFFQDPGCFHRELRPVTRNRLMLQLRYS